MTGADTEPVALVLLLLLMAGWVGLEAWGRRATDTAWGRRGRIALAVGLLGFAVMILRALLTA